MTISINFPDLGPRELQSLCGAGNRIMRRLEQHYNVSFFGKPGHWHIEGELARQAADSLQIIARKVEEGSIDDMDLEGILRSSCDGGNEAPPDMPSSDNIKLHAGQRVIAGKTRNQRHYLRSIRNSSLAIAVGPAGTGKTYLAVASAVVSLQTHQVERIVLTRPAVEAGERLGFLPGDIQQKVDPYLRPLYDALTDMLGSERLLTLVEAGHIEIAPLAYMRGRTLNDAFVILDEAQNTTREQMKMFLTRLGFGSRMVVTGDITQIDLVRKESSGLLQALKILAGVREVGISRLTGQDVIRHPLVERIVSAYENSETRRHA